MTRDPRSDRLHLPAASTVGRDHLIGATTDVVRENRLATLTGAGGVGKTRLALEIAGLMADDYPDGVRLVELAPIHDLTAVPSAIASALGITPSGDGVPVIDAVAEALAGQHLLLVVDNCEHVAAAASGAVATILGRSGTVSVLATSREPLWIAGEQRVAVGPLSTDGGIDSDAAKLFLDRARTVRFGFEPDDDSAGAIVEICHRLDGLPLAIELASARMASMSATELSDRLDHRFRLLRGDEHRPERHQTLTATVAWSCDLLGAAEREVLDAAAVFRGGFGLDDITAVVGGGDEIEILTRVDSLVARSLVVADTRAGSTRYRLLETIRQFVEDELSAERLEELRERHAMRYAAEASSRWDQWNGPGWRATSDWVEAELANLRVSFRWSADAALWEIATDIAAHAALIGVPAQLFETVEWAEELLELAEEADVPRLPRLFTAAGYACFAGRPGAGAANAHRATQLELQGGYDPCEPGLAMFAEALARVYSGDLDSYVEITGRVATIDGRARSFGLPAHVDGLQASGRVDEAVALAEESVAAAREVGNPFWMAYALWTAGLAHAARDSGRALALWDEGVEVVRSHRVRFFEGFLARDAARLHAEGDAPQSALQLFSDAVESFRSSGNVAQLIITLASVPALLERLGRLEGAASLHSAITRVPASVHHVPDLQAQAARLTEALDAEVLETRRAEGAMLDLSGAAQHALDQIELAHADLSPVAPKERPGGLTGRQVEVLELVAKGLTTQQIASTLFISAKTADHHIQHIYTKLGVSNRAAATRWAVEHAVVEFNR